MAKPYKRMDTTADVGLVSSGASLEEMFVNTAKGLFSLIAPLPEIRNRCDHKVRVEAQSWDELLVAWLNELIFVHEAENLLLRYFNITFLDKNRLEALCSGEHIDFKRHNLKTEVKAATYHRLSVWQSPDGLWRARVILDV